MRGLDYDTTIKEMLSGVTQVSSADARATIVFGRDESTGRLVLLVLDDVEASNACIDNMLGEAIEVLPGDAVSLRTSEVTLVVGYEDADSKYVSYIYIQKDGEPYHNERDSEEDQG